MQHSLLARFSVLDNCVGCEFSAIAELSFYFDGTYRFACATKAGCSHVLVLFFLSLLLQPSLVMYSFLLVVERSLLIRRVAVLRALEPSVAVLDGDDGDSGQEELRDRRMKSPFTPEFITSSVFRFYFFPKQCGHTLGVQHRQWLSTGVSRSFWIARVCHRGVATD